MRLQTLQNGSGGEVKILSETPWHDEASAVGGAYRERLKQYLGGFFERDETGMQPKAELLGDGKLQVPDAVRVVDDGGTVIESYSYKDLIADMGLPIGMPSAEALERR